MAVASASVATPAEQRFLQWLADHGARFPKIEWQRVTPNGLRGATARAPIATNEVMVSIPQKLMISEATCWSDPTLRRVYEENRDLFARDDPVLALFLVRELVHGEASFFYPYLSILPEVETVQEWTPAEQAELRDPSLVEAAVRRTTEMTAFYSKVMRRLGDKYPGEFPPDAYTFARFRFAWKTIQARTFGRRLPWTALVPFADCLNHANVATKYDFDVDGSGTFRLFPSASTSFAQGSEVFNSYGRRPNFQLLLDYGFVLEANEWDFVDVDVPGETTQMLGRRFPFRKRVRLDTATTVETLFPSSTFPPRASNTSANTDRVVEGEADDGDTVPSGMLGEARSREDALRWFHKLLLDALAQFETTLLEDEVRLVDDRLADRLRMAIVYRVGRMRILDRLVRALDDAIRAEAGPDNSSGQEDAVVDATPLENQRIE